jgi:hypothetical protein
MRLDNLPYFAAPPAGSKAVTGRKNSFAKRRENGTLDASGSTCTIAFRGFLVAGDGGIGTVTLSGDTPHGLQNKITLRNHALFIRS